VSNFINQAIEGLPITIYGDGSQTRSFQYIDDLISGLILMMNSKSDFIGPVNFGNTDEISINFLASAIKNMLKSKSKIIYRNLPEDDPVKRKPDITLAKNKLSWSPKIDLNSGLKKTIKYFMQYEKN
jgi:UDP-glucuronate decarboxylase